MEEQWPPEMASVIRVTYYIQMVSHTYKGGGDVLNSCSLLYLDCLAIILVIHGLSRFILNYMEPFCWSITVSGYLHISSVMYQGAQERAQLSWTYYHCFHLVLSSHCLVRLPYQKGMKPTSNMMTTSYMKTTSNMKTQSDTKAP